MKEQFKEAFGYTVGVALARLTIEIISEAFKMLAMYIDDPEGTKKATEKRIELIKKRTKPEKIKMGFC